MLNCSCSFLVLDIQSDACVVLLHVGELIGMMSIPLRMESDQETVPALSHWKLIQQSLLHGFQISWPLVQEKTYYLQLPSKKVWLFKIFKPSTLLDLAIASCSQ